MSGFGDCGHLTCLFAAGVTAGRLLLWRRCRGAPCVGTTVGTGSGVPAELVAGGRLSANRFPDATRTVRMGPGVWTERGLAGLSPVMPSVKRAAVSAALPVLGEVRVEGVGVGPGRFTGWWFSWGGSMIRC